MLARFSDEMHAASLTPAANGDIMEMEVPAEIVLAGCLGEKLTAGSALE
jgi:hypothetical protein